MALLAVASTLGGLATSTEVLITARVLQGVATAMTMPAALALITSAFPEGGKRDRALGLNAAFGCAGFTAGALVGGTLVDLLSWRAAFFVNVPVAVLVVLLAGSVLAESRAPDKARLDLPGGTVVTLGLLALIYGVTESNIPVVVAGLGLLGLFWVIERRSETPLAPPRVLRHRPVAWGNHASLVIFAVEPGLIFVLTVYLQEVLHLSPFRAGLVFSVSGSRAWPRWWPVSSADV